MFSPERTARPMRPRSGAAMGTVVYAGAGTVCWMHDAVFCRVTAVPLNW
jgi:hypothetical protein